MQLDDSQRSALDLAASVKGRMVSFATSAPLQRQLRTISREPDVRDLEDAGIVAVERLLFDFRYDDGSTVIQRFVARTALDPAEEEMAFGFTGGVESFFEVLDDTPAGAEVFETRCCLSDLLHLVAPTERAGMPQLERGAFLMGRLNPVAGTDLWTPSGALHHVPASSRAAVADSVMRLALQRPGLTHRNPEKRREATRRSADMHERFLSRHGGDHVVVAGADVAELYADVVTMVDGLDPDEVAAQRAAARRTIEESELAAADTVLVFSHPVGGIGFYREFADVACALEAGAEASPDALDALGWFLEDPSTPAWLVERVIGDRLPTSERALARALDRPDFSWDRDGPRLVLEGADESQLTLAIVPPISSGRT